METRKQKHREAQARYRVKHADTIRLKRFLKTKKGRRHGLEMLQVCDEVADETGQAELVLKDDLQVDKD